MIFSDDDPPNVLAQDSQGNTVGQTWLGQFEYGRSGGLPKRRQFVLKPGQSMLFTIADSTLLSGVVAKWYLDGALDSMWGEWNQFADYGCTNPLSSAR